MFVMCRWDPGEHLHIVQHSHSPQVCKLMSFVCANNKSRNVTTNTPQPHRLHINLNSFIHITANVPRLGFCRFHLQQGHLRLSPLMQFPPTQPQLYHPTLPWLATYTSPPVSSTSYSALSLEASRGTNYPKSKHLLLGQPLLEVRTVQPGGLTICTDTCVYATISTVLLTMIHIHKIKCSLYIV